MQIFSAKFSKSVSYTYYDCFYLSSLVGSRPLTVSSALSVNLESRPEYCKKEMHITYVCICTITWVFKHFTQGILDFRLKVVYEDKIVHADILELCLSKISYIWFFQWFFTYVFLKEKFGLVAANTVTGIGINLVFNKATQGYLSCSGCQVRGALCNGYLLLTHKIPLGKWNRAHNTHFSCSTMHCKNNQFGRN